MTLKTLADYPQRPLDADELALISTLYMNADEPGERKVVTATTFDEVSIQVGIPLLKIFARRLVDHGVNINVAAALVVSLNIDSPGDCVMWVWTLFNIRECRGRVITLDDVFTVFPLGFPVEQAKSDLWDSQKCPQGNLLDLAETWQNREPSIF